MSIQVLTPRLNKTRVMLNGDGNKNSNEINRKFARGAHLFVHFFAVVLHDYKAVMHD